jgi:hypothetical protein
MADDLIPDEGNPFEPTGSGSATLTPDTGDPFSPDPAPVPKPFLDRVLRGDALARALGTFRAAGQGAVEGFGEGPLGMSDETAQQWREHGIFSDPATGRPGLLPREDEAAVRALSVLGDTALRSIGAAIGAAGGVVGNLAEEAGLPNAAGLRRETSGFLEYELQRGDHARLEHSPEGARSQPIGPLPTDADFRTAAANLGGPATEQKLRDLWITRGIHPAEAAHDAGNDNFLRSELTSPDREPNATRRSPRAHREVSWQRPASHTLTGSSRATQLRP